MRRFNLNGDDYEMNEGFKDGPAPRGKYLVRIEDVEDHTGPSGSAYAKLRVRILCDHRGDKEWRGVAVWTTVSFHENAMGMTLHFLKCIGEPYEGRFTVDMDRWEDRIALASVRVVQDEGFDPKNDISGWQEWDRDKLPLPAPSDAVTTRREPSSERREKPATGGRREQPKARGRDILDDPWP